MFRCSNQWSSSLVTEPRPPLAYLYNSLCNYPYLKAVACSALLMSPGLQLAGLRNLSSRRSRVHKPARGHSSASQAKGSPSPGSLGLSFSRCQVRCACFHLPTTTRRDLTLPVYGTNQQTLDRQIDDRRLHSAVAFAGYDHILHHHGRSIHSPQVACGPLYRGL